MTTELPTGIAREQTSRHDGYVAEVRVRPYPKRKKRFSLETPVRVIEAWRHATIAELTEARRVLDRAAAAQADPLEPRTAPAAPRGTFRADVDDYLDRLMPEALKASQPQWPRYLRKLAAEDLGRLPRQLITGKMLADVLSKWTRDGIPASAGDGGRRRVVKPKPLAVDTARKIRTCWIGAWDALDRGLGLPNPARLVPRPPDDPGAVLEPGGIPYADALAIVAAMPKGSRTGARIALMVLLGLRPCEIMRIKPAHDWHRATNTLYVRTAKRGRPRTLPLEPAAVAALELLDTHPKGGWGTFTSAPAARMFHAAVIKAGMTKYEPLVPYAMRHTFASNAYALTGDLHAVSEGIGHKTLNQTKRYVEAAVSVRVGSMFAKIAEAMPAAPEPAAAPALALVRK